MAWWRSSRSRASWSMAMAARRDASDSTRDSASPGWPATVRNTSIVPMRLPSLNERIGMDQQERMPFAVSVGASWR